MNLNLIKRLVKCFIWHALPGGSEIWAMRKRERDRIEALKMWI